MPLSISKCDLTDGPTIAAMQLSTITSLMKYQFGCATTDALCEFLTHQHTRVLAPIPWVRSEKAYFKVIDTDSHDGSGEGKMIAWADWEVPRDESQSKSSGALPGRPPPGINREFCNMVVCAIEVMRSRVLKGRKCYMLNQLVTLPDHQRRGAGSMLLTLPFEEADREGVACYLDTEADGKALALYEKHKYVKVDQCEVDLGVCGLEGVYTHVAMVREPKTVVVKEVHREVIPQTLGERGFMLRRTFLEAQG